MNKITFVLLTVVVTLFTGFLGLIPMLIIGFNMFGESKAKTEKPKKKYLVHKWQVVAITIIFGLGTFYQESLAGAMVNGMLAAYVYYWADKRFKRNIEGQ